MRFVAFASALLLLLGGCLLSRGGNTIADARFGHRYTSPDTDGRATLQVVLPDSGARFFTYPVPIDSVYFRPAPFAPDSTTTRAEVLIKGTLPDACSELHRFEQERSGNLIQLRLLMRKPQGAVCAMMVRPFRYYALLEGRYPPGDYTIKINDETETYHYTIRPPGR